jgi:hypothetical protein
VGDVDYGELLRSNGIVIQTTDVDDGSMDSGADDSDDDDSMDDGSDDVSVSMEEKLDNDDLHAGTPLYGSATGDVDPKSPSLMGTHGKSQAVSHGHPPQESPPVMEEVMEKSQSVMVKPWDESW